MTQLRNTVLFRDKGCVIGLHIDRSHVCRDKWGFSHPPTELDLLSLEHVREHAGGERRDESGWCVAMCFAANAVTHEGSRLRDDIRLYLAGVRAGGRVMP